MPDPRSPEFWQQEHFKLLDSLDELILFAIAAGGMNGHNLLPKTLRILVNWDTFNTGVIDFIRRYGREVIRGITDTTRDTILQLIEDWIREGAPLDTLSRRMAALPTFSRNRADMIASTEVTRLYAEGNIMAWRSTGLVASKKWQTARDERVCLICGPLHGVIVPLNEGFTPEGPGLGPTAPPAHPRCRCWLLPVTSLAMLEDELDRILAVGA